MYEDYYEWVYRNTEPLKHDEYESRDQRRVEEARAFPPSLGLPTDPERLWDPWDFYSSAKGSSSWRKRGFGCGGAAVFRVIGEDGVTPEQLFKLDDVTVYGSMKDAVAALNSLPQGGAIVVYERGKDFPSLTASGMPAEDFAPWYEGGAGANFAIVLGTSENCYWEYATTGWRAKPYGKVKHSRGRAGWPHAVYLVIPARSTKTLSPVPSSWSNDGRDMFPKPEWRFKFGRDASFLF